MQLDTSKTPCHRCWLGVSDAYWKTKRTDILLFMLYAAYARTTAEVRVHTANVRAWRAVTARDEHERGVRTADTPVWAGTPLYILRVNLRVQKFCTVLKTAEAATRSCQ